MDLRPCHIGVGCKSYLVIGFLAVPLVRIDGQFHAFCFLKHKICTRTNFQFRQISTYTDENSLVCINTPNPEYIEYAREHEPKKLQTIDQSVQLLPLLQHLEGVGFEMIFFEKYSIWVREDYHFMVFRKRCPFAVRKLKDERKFSEKVINKIERNIDKLRYS